MSLCLSLCLGQPSDLLPTTLYPTEPTHPPTLRPPCAQVLMLDMDWGGMGDAAEDHYEKTLHSAVQGSGSSEPPGA